jgi:hypothetical protein
MPETTDTAWRDALLMAPGRVGGVQLLPLSAWHLHAMQITGMRFEFDRDGRGPTPGELANAIAICRSRWKIETVGVKEAPAWLIVWLKCRWVFVDWQLDAVAFLTHCARYRQCPVMEAPKKGASFTELGAPPYLARAVDLASKIPSMTLAEALNMPVVWLNCLRMTLLDLGGGLACAWNRTEGPSGQDIAAGLQAAEEAVKKAALAAQGAANGNA